MPYMDAMGSKQWNLHTVVLSIEAKLIDIPTPKKFTVLPALYKLKVRLASIHFELGKVILEISYTLHVYLKKTLISIHINFLKVFIPNMELSKKQQKQQPPLLFTVNHKFHKDCSPAAWLCAFQSRSVASLDLGDSSPKKGEIHHRKKSCTS